MDPEPAPATPATPPTPTTPCRLIGLAGGIASGKSTVARHLAALGAPVLDADQLARAVVAPGQPALAAIVRTFGRGFLTRDGALDRKALGARVFCDLRALAALNAITHPAIRALAEGEIAALARGGARWVIYEAALLAERGVPRDDLPPWHTSALHPALTVRGREGPGDAPHGAGDDAPGGVALGGTSLAPPLSDLVVVTAPGDVRLRRIMARDGLTEARARDRMASQVADEARLGLATIAVRNDGDAATLGDVSRALFELLVGRHGPVTGPDTGPDRQTDERARPVAPVEPA